MSTRPPLSVAALVALLLVVTACALQGCGPTPTTTTAQEPLALPALIPPLHDAAPNEWVVLGRGAEEYRYVVDGAGDTDVTAQVTHYENGTPLEKPIRVKWHRNGLGVPDGGVVRRIERARLEAGGRAWQCWLMHVFTKQGLFYYWMSDEVPAHGILKIARSEGGRPDERHALVWVTDSNQ